MKVTAEKANWAQQVYYCPYCSRTSLLYIWHEGRLIGLGLDKWLVCPKCKHKFKMGIYGIHEQELDVEITWKPQTQGATPSFNKDLTENQK